MRKGTSGSATVVVHATPEEVYDTVTDVTRIPEWSPECVRARWVGGADGPAVGARFRGVNRRGLVTWLNTPRVVTADRPREFSFVVGHRGFGDITRWTYQISPGDEPGTSKVTERFELQRHQPVPARVVMKSFLRGRARKDDLDENVRVSLQRLREVLEDGPSPES